MEQKLNMISYFNLTVLIVLINISCDLINNPKEPFITNEQRSLIYDFVVDNGYPETMPLDSFVEYIYKDWPYEYEIKDFILTFPVQDTVPRTLVLTDDLTKIGKNLRVHAFSSRNGNIYPAYIDSIEIRTDSVIVIPYLSLTDCNLTHLPPEIGKIRTECLDLSYNNLKELPLEVMSVFDHLPPGTGHIKIQGNPIANDYWSNLPDTMRNWIKANQGSNY